MRKQRVSNQRTATRLTKKFQSEIALLTRDALACAGDAPPELRSILSYQFRSIPGSKFFRPLIAWAIGDAKGLPRSVLRDSALAIQLFHESSLIIDDMIDRSRFRRGQLAAHCLYSRPVAMAAAGWIGLRGMEIVNEHYDKKAFPWLLEFGRHVALAEARQWMHRGKVGMELLPIVREIAEGDTGKLFELSAILGGASMPERRAVLDLGVAYHWLDDAQAILKRGVFGGRAKDPDERDGICTLVSVFEGNAESALKHVRKMIVQGSRSRFAWSRPFWQELSRLATA